MKMDTKTKKPAPKGRGSLNEVERQTKIPNYRPARQSPSGSRPMAGGHYLGPTSLSLLKEKPVTLIEALDRVLEKGVVLDGELILRVADIDLVYIGLRAIVTSISRMETLKSGAAPKERASRLERGSPEATLNRVEREDFKADLRYIEEVQREIEKASRNIPKIIDVSSPKTAEKGLAKLVLTLVKLIKDLTEKEAMRRIERGNLTDMEVQKLGITFKALDKKIEELRAVFGLKEKELNLDLGPLGQLM